jgi:polar amino acid transport system substrate-binding protein
MNSRQFLRLGAALVTGLVLAACGKKEPPAPAPAPVASAPAPAPAKVYAVGTDAAYAPFESQNEKGEIVGFDIEVVKAVAAKAGIEVKFVNTPMGRHLQCAGPGRPRHGGVGGDDHRRAQADDGLQRLPTSTRSSSSR